MNNIFNNGASIDIRDVKNMNWTNLFTSFDGRIDQRQFWIGVAVLFGCNVAVSVIVGVLAFVVPAFGYVMYVVALATLYPALALSTKRWHDRGKPGLWNLILLIPVVGQLYAIYELGFLPSADRPFDPSQGPR